MLFKECEYCEYSEIDVFECEEYLDCNLRLDTNKEWSEVLEDFNNNKKCRHYKYYS